MIQTEEACSMSVMHPPRPDDVSNDPVVRAR